MDHWTLSVVMPHSKETTPVKAQTEGSLNTEECISDTVAIQIAARHRMSTNSILSASYAIEKEPGAIKVWNEEQFDALTKYFIQ